MAEDRMMSPADVVARAMSGEHGDLLRDAVAMVVRELMEAEVAQLTGAARRARRRTRDPSQRLPPAALGDAGRRDRSGDPQDAFGAGVLSFVYRAAPAL